MDARQLGILDEEDELAREEFEEDVEVPFAVIENVPVFPGCERGNNEKKRKYFYGRNFVWHWFYFSPSALL